MAQTFSSLIVHVVFSTKWRARSISKEIRAPLWAYMGGIVRNIGLKPILINGVTDHVHLLLGMVPVVSISECVRVVKSNSSGWIHESRPSCRFAWQDGYAAFSVSRSDLDRIYRYIAAQEEHHRKISFHEELLAMLRSHNIAFDERYLLG
ncbi:MAG: IS200/IS605 family transposase [Acidobacteria bacterium]|nr:IS200/IS605 family transposase [Acidobacteriota bacterium]